MRWQQSLAVSLLLLGEIAAGYARSPHVPATVPTIQKDWQAAFTPWDDIESLLIGAIAHARKQVLVQAYLLTNKKIAASLLAAHRRGVDVQILVDANQLAKKHSAVPELAAAGIPVWLETKYQNAHNKVIVIDNGSDAATLVTGSFNFTWTAQHRNAENVLIVRNNPALIARYAENWKRHRVEATRYKQ